jgi:REP element-mobilizing transposase RayT
VPHVRPARANVGNFFFQMPKNLKRYYGKGDLHFLTFSCFRRFALLGRARARNVFVRALGEVRKKYGIAVVGYVVMPEHVHLLIGESKKGTPSSVVHSLKLRVSKRMRRGRRKQSASPEDAAVSRRGKRVVPILAKAVLRFQRLEMGKEERKTEQFYA